MKTLISAFFLLISSLVAEPKAIIFDFGGVMTGELNQTVLPKWLLETCSLSEEDFANGRKARRLSDTPDKVFWRSWAEKNGISLSDSFEKEFNEALRESINPNESMYNLVDKITRKGIQVGMLSNINKRHGELVRDLGLYAPFKPCLLSYQTKLDKPTREAYEHLIKTLKISKKYILFVDDKKLNCDDAQKAGLDTILFTSYEDFIEELAERGVLLD